MCKYLNFVVYNGLMKATQQLKDEHQGIKIALAVLEKISRRLEQGEDVQIGHLQQLLEFLQVFVDRCHHSKEEEVLFPAMKKAGLPEGGPIQVMLAEHALGRNYIKGLSEAVKKYRSGDKPAGKEIAENARGYSRLLESHIEKENNILYCLADAVLDQKKQDELFEEFEKIETEKIGSGKHEQFHKLLDELQKIYLQ